MFTSSPIIYSFVICICILNDTQLKQPFILKEALVQSYLQIPVTQIQEEKVETLQKNDLTE